MGEERGKQRDGGRKERREGEEKGVEGEKEGMKAGLQRCKSEKLLIYSPHSF